MTNERLAEPRVYLGCELTESEEVGTGQGQIVVFAARSPEKEGGKRNEDSAAVFPIGPDATVLALADGCGGMPRGGEAADLAIECLRHSLVDAGPDDLRAAILNGVEHADVAIRDLGVGAATTLVVAEVHGRTARAYHVGDSGLMVVGNRGKVRFQTIAHSPVGYAVESGMLDEHGAMHHEDRNLVSNLLGIDGMRIDIGPKIRLQSRDTLLIASDGLFDNLRQQEIVDVVRKGPLAAAASALQVECAKRMAAAEGAGVPSKPDDLSFALFRLRPDASVP